MLESTVSLSYIERLKAEWAVATGRVTSLAGLAFFPACGFLLILLWGANDGWLYLLMIVLCFAFVPAAFLISAYRGVIAARKNGPFVYRISPDGFELKTPTAELKQSWAGIPRLRISFGLLLIYGNTKCAYPLPLKQVTPEQVQSVLTWAKNGGAQRVARPPDVA